MRLPRPHDDPAYADTGRDKVRPLRIRRLMEAGAFRVTYAADGRGGYTKSASPDAFSIVTPANEQQTGPLSPRHWPTKRAAIPTALRLLRGRWLDNGKFLQIVDSAKALGLADPDIFTKP